MDVVVVGVGGGGLISGIAAALKESRPGVRVYGVEPERSNAMSLALAAGTIVRLQPASIADGLGAPFAGEWTLAMTQRYVDDVVLIDDATILGGLRFALERTKQVLEPAGAAALAALLYGRIKLRAGDRVAVVLRGCESFGEGIPMEDRRSYDSAHGRAVRSPARRRPSCRA